MTDPRGATDEGEALLPGERIHHPQKGSAVVRGVKDGIVTARFDDGEVRQFLANHPGIRRFGPFDEGRISPAWGEINDPERFLPALTPGELELARYLDDVLPPDWRIFVRPHLDADRPLLAALHPEAGGMFWDVVDWDLSDFEVERGVWRSPGGGRFGSPYRFLNQVRERVYGVYVPELGEALNDGRRRFSVLWAGIYFPHAPTAMARRLASADPASGPIETFGSDALDRSRPERVLPIMRRRDVLERGWYDALHRTFTHDLRTYDPLQAIKLNREQERKARQRGSYIAIEGVAGSGKTLVLAYRAAAAAADGQRVLIITFNRTLANYIRGLIQLMPFAYRPDRITVLHFHELCRRIHDHHRAPLPRVAKGDGHSDEPNQDLELPDQESLEERWPTSAMRIVEDLGIPPELRFGLVLIDEGQDFSPTWFGLIQALGSPEIVLAYDSAQRLYERDEAITTKDIAKLFGARASRGAPLGKAVRLPAASVAIANDFAAHWSLATPALLVDDEGLLPPDAAVTVLPADTSAAGAAVVVSALESWRREPDYRGRDVAVIVPSKSIGCALVRLLAERGASTNHVFPVAYTGALMDMQLGDEGDPPWRIAQAQKTAFSFGDARLKVSTVHSFKGWEADRVILLLPFGAASPRMVSQVYVGLTRSRGQLLLVGRVEAFGLDALPRHPGFDAGPDASLAARFRELLSIATKAPPARRTGSRSVRPVEPEWLHDEPESWHFEGEGEN